MREILAKIRAEILPKISRSIASLNSRIKTTKSFASLKIVIKEKLQKLGTRISRVLSRRVGVKTPPKITSKIAPNITPKTSPELATESSQKTSRKKSKTKPKTTLSPREFISGVLLKIFGWGFALLATLGIGLGIYAATLLPGLPTIAEIREIPLNIPLRIYNIDNQLIAEYGNERRIPVNMDDTPPLLIDAVLATEDDQFYHHTGVDFPGILRAGWANLRSQTRAQGASTITMQVARNFFLTPERTYTRKLKEVLLAFNMERALTKDEILQLYFNKIFLGHRAYGFAAASKVYYGSDLADLSIPQIAMLAGLPKAPSRDNPISNPARAEQRRDYVLKRLYELGKIDEFSYNAARKAPVTAIRHVDGAEVQAPFVAEMARQVMVEKFGERVYEKGYRVTVTIDSDYQVQADEALRNGLLAYDKRHGFRGAVGTINLDAQTPEAIDEALLAYPKSRELIPAVVTKTSERSITALTQDQETIEIAWEHIKWAREYINANSVGDEPSNAAAVVARGDVVYASRDFDDGWRLNQMPKVSGALVSLDAASGAILALTGGFDYYLSKFNRATQALRQPGSNIKPFIYSAALDNGFTAGSVVSAGPIVVEDDLEGIWRPQNYSKKFFGPTRLREALSRSLNLVSVRLVRAIGIEKTIAHLAKFGFDEEALPRSLSLALGSVAVAPVDLAAAFAVFANGGLQVRPYLIHEIRDGDGDEVVLSAAECPYCRARDLDDDEFVLGDDEVDADDDVVINDGGDSGDDDGDDSVVVDDVDTAEKIVAGKRVISPQNAFLTSELLRQVIRTGTGKRALKLQRDDLAGKTGTTNNFRDAWFSGFNRDIATTVFVGFDEPSHLGRRESGASAALPIWVDFMGAILKDRPQRATPMPPNITAEFVNKTTGKRTAHNDPEGYIEYYQTGTEPDNEVESIVDGGAPNEDESKSESLF